MDLREMRFKLKKWMELTQNRV